MIKCALVAVLIGSSLWACKHPIPDAAPREGRSSAAEAVVNCGPDLTEQEVVAVARQAMQILWRDASLDEFDLRVEQVGCDYHFFAIRRGTEAAEDIFFSIDRSGRVNSAPECWWLGDLGNCPMKDEEQVSGEEGQSAKARAGATGADLLRLARRQRQLKQEGKLRLDCPVKATVQAS